MDARQCIKDKEGYGLKDRDSKWLKAKVKWQGSNYTGTKKSDFQINNLIFIFANIQK